MSYGVTDAGFVLKRFPEIRQSIVDELNTIVDPVTGETLVVDLTDENDPLALLVNAVSAELAAGWEQLQVTYNQFDPLKATRAGLAGLVQLNGLRKQDGETDTRLRTRQQSSTENTGGSMIETIHSGILAVPGVQFCRVYQNPGLVADARGIPGKSLAPVIVGGADAAIADVLFVRTPAGMGFHGTTSVSKFDVQLFEYIMKFTRPVNVPVYIAISLSVVQSGLWASDSEDRIKEAIMSYVQSGAAGLGITNGFDQVGFVPGVSVQASELYVPVNSQPGIKINSLFVGIAPAPVGAEVVIDWNKRAIFDIDNIDITVV